MQALLAFSALHQQLREKRAQTLHDENPAAPGDAHKLEDFVLDEVLQLVSSRALAITGCDGVAIALAEADAIICRARVGNIAPDAGVRLDPNSGFSGACLTSGQVIRCDDSETDPRVNADTCRTLGARSMVAVPLSAKQRIIGLLEAFSGEPYGFNDCDVRSLALLAELILAALRPEEENRLAEISQLTVPEAEVRLTPAVVDIPAAETLHVAVVAESPVVPEVMLPEAEVVSARAEDLPAEPASERPAEIERHLTESKTEETAGPATAETRGLPANDRRPGLAVAATLILVALTAGGGLWWNMQRWSRIAYVQPGRVSAPAIGTPSARPDATPAVEAANLPAVQEDEGTQEVPSTASTGEKPRVTGIRHWSSADSSTVVIDLEDQVQYEAHRLSHPERIYVDLPETRLAPSLFNKTIDVGDALLQRVRVAQPTNGVTRVVLETKGASNFSVSLEPNPYRLVIEVTSISAEPKPRAKVELFGPKIEAAQPSLFAKAPTTELPPKMRTGDPRLRIVLDAGHGGWDLGTVGRKGLLEKDLVLDIVERLGKLVEQNLAASVIYTRSDDSYVALEKRAEVANLAKASLFLSVHANYSDFPSARGVETYYTNTYSSVRARSKDDGAAITDVDWTNVDIRGKVHESRRLAASVQRALYGTLSAKNPGLTNRGVKQAQYVVLTGTSMPAVLAEVSFVSSPTDENNLQSSSYRQQIAEALYQGVARYAEQSRVKIASALARPGQ